MKSVQKLRFSRLIPLVVAFVALPARADVGIDPECPKVAVYEFREKDSLVSLLTELEFSPLDGKDGWIQFFEKRYPTLIGPGGRNIKPGVRIVMPIPACPLPDEWVVIYGFLVKAGERIPSIGVVVPKVSNAGMRDEVFNLFEDELAQSENVNESLEEFISRALHSVHGVMRPKSPLKASEP